jgi:hypothetical protein
MQNHRGHRVYKERIIKEKSYSVVSPLNRVALQHTLAFIFGLFKGVHPVK